MTSRTLFKCSTAKLQGTGGNLGHMLGSIILLIIAFDRWEWAEGLFDCSWSEHNQDFSITASGDGSLQMWDLKNPMVTSQPDVFLETISIPEYYIT